MVFIKGKSVLPYILKPVDVLEVPEGYQFHSVEVDELNGRQTVVVRLEQLPPPLAAVVFYASTGIDVDVDCDDEEESGW